MASWARLQNCSLGIASYNPSPQKSTLHFWFYVNLSLQHCLFCLQIWESCSAPGMVGRTPPFVVTKLCPTLCDPRTAAHQSFLSFTVSQSVLKLMSIESVGDAMQPFHPLWHPSPPALNLSQHQGLF